MAPTIAPPPPPLPPPVPVTNGKSALVVSPPPPPPPPPPAPALAQLENEIQIHNSANRVNSVNGVAANTASRENEDEFQQHRDGASDYSSVGDYSDNADFYDPNDAVPEEDSGGPVSAMDIVLDDEDNPPHALEGPVRQNSNFSRLSAQSWLTVDSVEDVDDGGIPGDTLLGRVGSTPVGVSASPSAVASAGAGAGAGAGPKAGKDIGSDIAQTDEDDPLRQVRSDQARILDAVRGKRLADKSVFECAVELLAGMAAYKKKSFRRFGARRVWLSSDCTHLCWTSKKDNVDSDSIKLQRVAKLKCVERELAVDVVEGYRVSLLFSTPTEAGLWARCLSCLIPLQARVRAPTAVLLREKDREDFTLEDDTFHALSLRDHFQVNSYAVLAPVKGHSGQARLAFSRSEKRFVGIRYITRRLNPLILRSYEEIAVLKRLDHPNIIRHTECLTYQPNGGSFVVFEHAARGTVADTSKIDSAPTIPERAARDLIADIVDALEYLHALRIAHADVRPDNLLRAVNGAVKVNPLGCITHDFTEVKSMQLLTQARLAGATSAFLAPELCWRAAEAPKLPPKSYAMDVWAVGAVLYFMLYGRVPFGGNTEEEIQQNICTGKLRFPRQPETTRVVRNLLKGVLGEKDPRTRIPMAELKSHPWFQESTTPIVEHNYGNQPLLVAPEEVAKAVQVAKVRIPQQSNRR